MGVDRVLYRKFVEAEFLSHSLELLFCGLVEPDPGEGVGSVAVLVGALQHKRIRKANPIAIQSGVDDHACQATPGQIRRGLYRA